METYLGIDLGGTKLLIGEVDKSGKILRSKRYESGHLNQDEAMAVIIASLDDYIENVGWVGEKPAAMGLGVIGRINYREGIWLQIDQDRTGAINVAELLSARYGMPCFMDNDVKSAVKAEILWGIGRESKDFLYINVGTGLASGAVVDGHIIGGGHFNAGETGHVSSRIHLGLKCACGREDCAELIASGSGIDTCARALAPSYDTKLVIPEGRRVDVAEVIALASQGDALCSLLKDNATTAIADLIMDLIRCYDPQTIVMGGGVISGDGMLEETIAKVNPFTARFVTGGIRMTELDAAYVGLLGAAANAMI